MALLLRSYSTCRPDNLTDVERQKMIARAKTIITIGHGLLQKLGASVAKGVC
jgi:hypothetical protein